jgi:hypothetical protein
MAKAIKQITMARVPENRVIIFSSYSQKAGSVRPTASLR